MASAATLLNVTATLGPFGLAFTSETLAIQRLSCATLGGRPFVTSLHVQRLTAPLGGRDVYEFRIECGVGASEWTTLGPLSSLWSTSHRGEAACTRPASATGLLVSRGRSQGLFWGGQDLFGFSLVCGAGTLVDVLDAGDNVEENRAKRCPDDSFISGVEAPHVTLSVEPQALRPGGRCF